MKAGKQDEEETWSVGGIEEKSRQQRVGGGAGGGTGCHSSRTNKPLDGISSLIGPLSGRRGRQGRRGANNRVTLLTATRYERHPTPIKGGNCVPPSVPPSLWICINELQGELEEGSRRLAGRRSQFLPATGLPCE